MVGAVAAACSRREDIRINAGNVLGRGCSKFSLSSATFTHLRWVARLVPKMTHTVAPLNASIVGIQVGCAAFPRGPFVTVHRQGLNGQSNRTLEIPR